jgi:predicted nucleotidyltransferase
LKISIETILERKRVLLKREKFGKTGVFIKREIEVGESTEDILKKLAKSKSIVRKKLRSV